MDIYGCDVGAKSIILHDGKKAHQISTPLEAKAIIKNPAVIVLEQTGAYGIRWAEIFTSMGCKVFIADGRDFKNYRLAHSKKKDDRLDAFYLRKYYLEKKPKCRPYNPTQTHIRALIRQHIRNEKDLTKHTNRLKQYLAMIFPMEEYHLFSRTKLFKLLPSLEQRLKQIPHALNELALSELRKLQIALEENQRLEKEIISIARNHPDYEVLKTFPIGDLQIATLLAYSWDIKNFEDKNGYIAYVLMGANLEQSGTSLYKVKTDKARTEIKGIFYPLYMLSHRKTKNWTHPLRPLTELVKDLVNASHNFKKRYIKFLSRFLELTYYARKHRLTYLEILKLKLKRLENELLTTKREEPLSDQKGYKVYRLTRAISTYREMLSLANAQRKDISFLSQRGEEERQAYLCEEPQGIKEATHEGPNQTRTITRDNPPTKRKTPQPNTTHDRGHHNDVPPFLKRKSPDRRSDHQTETLRNFYEESQKDQEDEIPY
ncbi:MAG: IS110 family transposase [Aquificae bacterium]|nr:IS110 family transposase [Aquificota bacterium]